jgi:hypothetical protein
MKKRVRKAEIMGLSFNMIFSIILIIVFIVVAWIAIKIFWNPSECALLDRSQEGIFKTDLQNAINDAWNSETTNSEFKITLPGKIQYVCFLNFDSTKTGSYTEFVNDMTLFGRGNLYLYPSKKACDGFRSLTLQHINIEEITKNENPYCVENKNNAKLKIEKGFYDKLVKISKA